MTNYRLISIITSLSKVMEKNYIKEIKQLFNKICPRHNMVFPDTNLRNTQ